MLLQVKSRDGIPRSISRDGIDFLGGREDPLKGESGSKANRTDIFPFLPIAQMNSNGVWSSDIKDEGVDPENSAGEGPNSGANLSLKNARYSWRSSSG
jgi:hypothetical protein